MGREVKQNVRNDKVQGSLAVGLQLLQLQRYAFCSGNGRRQAGLREERVRAGQLTEIVSSKSTTLGPVGWLSEETTVVIQAGPRFELRDPCGGREKPVSDLHMHPHTEINK